MCSFSLFLSFTAILSITVTLSNETCPTSAIKPQVSIILTLHTLGACVMIMHAQIVDLHTQQNYTVRWYTVQHLFYNIIPCRFLTILCTQHYVKQYVTPERTTAKPWLCTRRELGTYVLVSGPVFPERQGGCFRILQCCNLFVGTRMHFESRNKSLQQGNISSSAMVNCT